MPRSASETHAATNRGVFVRDDAVAASQMLGKATALVRRLHSFLMAMQIHTEECSSDLMGARSCGSLWVLFVSNLSVS